MSRALVQQSRLLLVVMLVPALLPGLAAAQSPPPVLLVADTGPAVLTGLPAVLGGDTLMEELHSGLTNSLLLMVTVDPGHGRKIRGAASVDIRYELWDEVYLVTVTDLQGRSRQEAIASLEELHAWWRGLRLAVLAPAALTGSRPRGPAEVELRLLPFSQAEQRDAQLWLTRSVGAATPAASSGQERPAGETNDRVLDILVATSIKRRPVLTFRWPATIATGSAGESEDDG